MKTKKKVEEVKKTEVSKKVAKPKMPVSFKTYAIYQPKVKKFLADIKIAKTGKPIRKCSDKYFMTFASTEEAKAAYEVAECTSGYRVVKIEFLL